MPEFAGPKLNGRSSLVTIDVELKQGSAGVLYAQGAFSGGLALWVDRGKLVFEYNLFEIERTRIESKDPLPTGKVKIEVETRVAAPRGAADIAVRVDGKAMQTDFVCIPRPIERAPGVDGGPLRYRVRHEVALWRAGERPQLRQSVLEGDAGLSV